MTLEQQPFLELHAEIARWYRSGKVPKDLELSSQAISNPMRGVTYMVTISMKRGELQGSHIFCEPLPKGPRKLSKFVAEHLDAALEKMKKPAPFGKVFTADPKWIPIPGAYDPRRVAEETLELMKSIDKKLDALLARS